MVDRDFSKCQCSEPGWCDLFKKEMSATPPNWQWCQSLTERQRKEYFDKVNGMIRTVRRSIRDGKIDVINFVDELPKQTSQYAVCVIPATENQLEILDITRDSIKAYAEKCGADYIELTGDQYPRWPMANKYRVHEVTKTYEKTLYLDCDIYIKPDTPNLFEITPDDKISAFDEWAEWEDVGDINWIQVEQDVIVRRLFTSDERSQYLDNGRFTAKTALNGGVLVIPRDLADYYEQPKRVYPRQWCFDQHLLSILLPENKLNKLDYKFNCCYTSNGFLWKQKSAHIIHFNNIKNIEQRKRLIKAVIEGEGSVRSDLLIHTDVSMSERFGWCKTALQNQVEINESLYTYVDNQSKQVANKLDRVCILVLGHDDSQFASIKPRPYLKFVNLNTINAGEYCGNEWAESRIYKSEDNLFADNVEYYGCVTASWNNKYEDLKIDDFHNWFSSQILLKSKPEDNIFLCADLFCCCGWLKSPGIMTRSLGLPSANQWIKQILKMCKLSTRFYHRPVPFSNQGIYHKSVFQDYKKFLDEQEVFEKLKWLLNDKYDIDNDDRIDALHKKRIHAYFLEAISTVWLIHTDYNFIGNTNRRPDWYLKPRQSRGW